MKHSIVLVLLLAACGSSSKAEPSPPPLTIAISAVERKAEVAPNETYAQQGLGTKAAAGKTFLCPRVAITKSKADALVPSPVLTAGADSYPVHVGATAHHETSLGVKDDEQAPCFEIPEGAQGPFELTYEKEKWGKNPGWKVSAKLPS